MMQTLGENEQKMEIRTKGLLPHDAATLCRRGVRDGASEPACEHDMKNAPEGREEGLDNTLADTFPCSDPLSSIPNPLRKV